MPTCWASHEGLTRPTFCQKSKCPCVPHEDGGVSSYLDDQYCDEADPAERGCLCEGMCCLRSEEFVKDVQKNCEFGNKKSDEKYPCVQRKHVNTCAEPEAEDARPVKVKGIIGTGRPR